MEHFYDLGYFFSRNDSGSIYRKVDKELDIDDIDESIAYLLEKGLLPKEYANNIIYIEELSQEEFQDLTGEA